MVSRRTGVTIGANTRATSDDVDRWLNQAIGKYHLELTRTGDQAIKRTTLTTSASTTETNGWPANEFVAFPSDFFALVGLTIYDGDRRLTMNEFSEAQRDEFEQDWASYWSPGLPVEYRLAVDTADSKGARLLPPSDGAYTIELLYIPTGTALAHEEATHTFITGTEDVVVCDAAMMLLQGDGIPEPKAYDEIVRSRNEALMLLKRFAAAQNRSGSSGMVNTRRQRDRNRRFASPFWRGIT